MGNPSAAQRRIFAANGIAMPDGSYYIRPDYPEDLTNAIRAVGRASGSGGTSDEAQRNAVRRHIIKRANALKRSNEIPDTWNADGTLKHAEILLVDELNFDEIEDFLMHHGVKGMKWGVRRDRGHVGEAAKTKTIAKLDKRFENPTFKDVVAIHNKAANAMNNGIIASINNKSQYRNQNFVKNPDTPLARKYYAEHAAAYQNQLNKAAMAYGTNASGTRRYSVTARDGGLAIKVVDVTHADASSFFIRPKMDERGFIISIDPSENDILQQSDIDVFLEHFGVKGMHWGVRKDRSSASTTPRKPASADARAADHAREKLKTSGIHTLSNKELQDLVNRMNLEKKYGDLTSTPAGQSSVKRGRSFVEEQTKTARAGINLYKTGKEVATILGPLLVAGAAYGAARKAGYSGPVKMPQLAITAG